MVHEINLDLCYTSALWESSTRVASSLSSVERQCAPTKFVALTLTRKKKKQGFACRKKLYITNREMSSCKCLPSISWRKGNTVRYDPEMFVREQEKRKMKAEPHLLKSQERSRVSCKTLYRRGKYCFYHNKVPGNHTLEMFDRGSRYLVTITSLHHNYRQISSRSF
jgi:hypothetical protein